MLCIELNRNGQRLATAGLQGKGVLSVIFDRVLSDAHGPMERRHFRLGGLDTSTEPNSMLHWIGGPVEIGDTFTVRFLDSDSADPPTHSEPSTEPTPAELRRFRQQQLRNLESELKKVRAFLAVDSRRKKSRPVRNRKIARRNKARV
jgi:hypothetical protein